MTNEQIKKIIDAASSGKGFPALVKLLQTLHELDPETAERVGFRRMLPDIMEDMTARASQLLQLLLIVSLDETCDGLDKDGNRTHPPHTINGEEAARGMLAAAMVDVIRDVIKDDHCVLGAVEASYKRRPGEGVFVASAHVDDDDTPAKKEYH